MLPDVQFLSAEVRVGGVSAGVGVVRDNSGRVFVTASFGGSPAMIDGGFAAATKEGMMAAAIAAIFSYKASINVGGSYQKIEDFVDIHSPSVNFTIHSAVGLSADIEGKSYQVSMGP